MNPTAGDVHVKQALTDVSVAYIQGAGNFVAGQVFPTVPVMKQADRYYVYDRASFNRDEMEPRAPATESKGGTYTLDNTPTYYAEKYSYHHDIPDEVRGNSDPAADPDEAASEIVSVKALINREARFATNYLSAGVWTNERQGAATPSGGQFLQWDDANSDPIGDIRASITVIEELTGFSPNVFSLAKGVFDVLIDHPDIVDRVKYGTQSQVSVVDAAELAALFKIERVLVMKGVQTTTPEGAAAEVSQFISKKTAFLSYSAPNPGLMVPTAGYTFVWNSLPGVGSEGVRVKEFRMDQLDADRVEIDSFYDQKVVSPDLGYLFYDAIA